MQSSSTEGDALILAKPENERVGSDTTQTHEESRSKPSAQKKNDVSKKLERHNMSLWLASAFSIASVVIWAITCTLSYKPIQFKNYFDADGRYSSGQFEQNDRWRKVSRIGLQILGTLSIPLTSAVCTSAVVVYCQRSSSTRQPAISMRQTLVLADKGWLDLNTWVDLFSPMGRRIYSPLLIISMLLCGLAFTISTLQGAFIDTVSITVMTHADSTWPFQPPLIPPRSINPTNYSNVGTTLSRLLPIEDLYIPSVIEATIAGKAEDLQPNLWMIGRNSSHLTSMDSFYADAVHGSYSEQAEGYNRPTRSLQTAFQAKPFFTSSLTVGTDTGILRVLALRLGTSLQCQDVRQTEFPSDCNDTASFAANFTNIQYSSVSNESLSQSYYIAPIFTFHVCSPEAKNWTRHNGSSQSIQEELYIDLQTWPSSATENSWGYASMTPIRYNFTYHCIADSSVGYFEPMNEWNGHQVQDMVDINSTDNPHFTGPNTQSNTRNFIDSPAAPGPLATSVKALFGNNTFFNSVVNANDTRGANFDVCRALRMPLTGLCAQRDTDYLMCNPFQARSGSTLPCIRAGDLSGTLTTEDAYPEDYGLSNATAASGTLAFFLYMWLQKFQDWNSTMAALTLTNFYSARAILDPSRARRLSDEPFGVNSPRLSQTPLALPIFSSPGFQTQKIHIPFTAIVVISTLILLQIMGLLALAVYAYQKHTWTASLDGFAMLRMGKAMGDALPLVSAASKREAEILDRVEGWIGDQNDDADDDDYRKGENNDRLLQIGGNGGVVSKARYRTM